MNIVQSTSNTITTTYSLSFNIGIVIDLLLQFLIFGFVVITFYWIIMKYWNYVNSKLYSVNNTDGVKNVKPAKKKILRKRK